MSQGAVTLVVDRPKACREVQLVVVQEWDDTLWIAAQNTDGGV